MRKAFAEYVRKHKQEHYEKERIKPVVTISRAFGCPSIDIAKKLADRLSGGQQGKGSHPWTWVSKDIIHQSAEKMGEDDAAFELQGKKKMDNPLSEIINCFSHLSRPPAQKIRRIIRETISDIADDGYVVIIGRGSEVITYDRPNTLHLRLMAPLEWRAQRMIEFKKAKSIKEAKELIEKMDAERAKYRKSFLKDLDFEHFFDVEINCASFSEDQIVAQIVQMMEQKSIR